MKPRAFDVADWGLIAAMVNSYAMALWTSKPDGYTSAVNVALGATAAVAGGVLLFVDLRRKRLAKAAKRAKSRHP